MLTVYLLCSHSAKCRHCWQPRRKPPQMNTFCICLDHGIALAQNSFRRAAPRALQALTFPSTAKLRRSLRTSPAREDFTLLYQIVQEYWPEFQAELAGHGKYLPTYVTKEFDEYLKCGRLEYGFLRVRCANRVDGLKELFRFVTAYTAIRSRLDLVWTKTCRIEK